MAAVFVRTRNVYAVIEVEAPWHIFFAGTEPWLGRYGALYCLRICSLSPGQ